MQAILEREQKEIGGMWYMQRKSAVAVRLMGRLRALREQSFVCLR